MLPKDVANERGQGGITRFTNRRITRQPGQAGRAADLQHLTHGAHGLGLANGDGFDSRIHVGHSLRPKMTNAFFRMSRSRVTRARSVSSSCTRASSDSATGPDAFSCSALQRYRTLGLASPNRSATEAAECPSSYIATASRRNSSVNTRRDRFAWATFLTGR